MEPKPVPPITAEQQQLLGPWYSQNGRDSRTLTLYDAIPKYPFRTTRFVETADPLTVVFTVKERHYATELWPARVKVASGETRLAFPGAREELVERALRFLAVQQLAQTRITPNGDNNGITVWFSLSMIRRHLEELGHGCKLSEVKEALDILSDTRIRVHDADAAEKGRDVFKQAAIFSRYEGNYGKGDITGEDSLGAVAFHPLATQAILELAFYPINQLRVGRLKMPLARWLTSRMSHNYRQASREALLLRREGYHIALSTIFEERALVRQKRLRASLEDVRRALTEMCEANVLRSPDSASVLSGPAYNEKLTYVRTERRPAVVDAVWILYPSPEFIEEIVQGNVDMKRARLG